MIWYYKFIDEYWIEAVPIDAFSLSGVTRSMILRKEAALMAPFSTKTSASSKMSVLDEETISDERDGKDGDELEPDRPRFPSLTGPCFSE